MGLEEVVLIEGGLIRGEGVVEEGDTREELALRGSNEKGSVSAKLDFAFFEEGLLRGFGAAVEDGDRWAIGVRDRDSRLGPKILRRSFNGSRLIRFVVIVVSRRLLSPLRVSYGLLGFQRVS